MTTEPVLNVPLLTKVLDHITANPKEWNQDLWAVKTTCGTACCVAGWAVVMTGHTLDFTRGRTSADYTTGGELIDQVAQRELGLTLDQADDLFESGNDLSALWEYANEYSNGEIQQLDKESA